MKKLRPGACLVLLTVMAIMVIACMSPVTPDLIQVETLTGPDYSCIKVFTVDGHEYLAQCSVASGLVHKANCKAGDGTEKPKAEK